MLDSVSSIAHILVVESAIPLKSSIDVTLTKSTLTTVGVTAQFLISAPTIFALVKYPANVAFRVNVCSESTFPRLLTRSLTHSLVNLVAEISTDFNQLVHLRDVSLEQL